MLLPRLFMAGRLVIEGDNSLHREMESFVKTGTTEQLEALGLEELGNEFMREASRRKEECEQIKP